MNQAGRPKIVYVLPNYDPDIGSHFFHIYEMINLAVADLDIRLVIERSGIKAEELPIPGYIQKFSFPPLRFGELFFVLAKERMLGRRFFYTHYSFYGALVSWLVTRLFGGTAYYWNCGEPWRYSRPRLQERIFRFILRHTLLVTGTPGMARAYAEHYGLDHGAIRVLPNWINLNRWQSGTQTGNTYDRNYFREKFKIPLGFKIILFVHRLSRRKGAHFLPEIIRQVTEKDKNAMFLIVGAGPEAESLKFKVKSSKLEPYVRLAGEVAHREIPEYYQAADVFLMPSEEEGFPHVLLEAMAAGVPYVASDVGGVREITPPEFQNFIVPSGNIGMFATKILELLVKPSEAIAKISNSEQEWAKKYDIKAVRPQFIKLFEF